VSAALGVSFVVAFVGVVAVAGYVFGFDFFAADTTHKHGHSNQELHGLRFY
jgi:hypothetical protein